MKVLIVAPPGSPIINRLIRALKERGIEVFAAGYDVKDQQDFIDLGRLNNIFDFFKFWKIKSLVSKINPDIIHAHIANHYGIMSIFAGKPVLLGLWGSEIMLDPYGKSRIKSAILRLVNWIALSMATRCHTSGYHVGVEAVKQCSMVRNKLDVFYWGIPLEDLSAEVLCLTQRKLAEEFGLQSQGNIVFPRGVADVYNPVAVSKIINRLYSKYGHEKNLVVLTAFSSIPEVNAFKKMIKPKGVIVVNRLLNDEELFALYSSCKVHVSIPKSDSLGGGVIEPAILGSVPLLSAIPSYSQFVKSKNAIFLEEDSDSSIEKAVDSINDIINETESYGSQLPKGVSRSDVIYQLINSYKKTVNAFNRNL